MLSALELEEIGGKLVDEFTEIDYEEGFSCLQHTFVTNHNAFGFGPGRINAERLQRVLDRCGFKIIREEL